MAKKTKKKNYAPVPVKVTKKLDKKKALIMFISIFLGVVILAGAITAAAIGITRASYLMLYEDTGISEGVANYFVSYYKTNYLSMFSGASDTEAFWSAMRYKDETEDGYTYGEDMTNYVTQAIKETIAQSALFDKYATITAADRDLINESVNEILTFRAGGSVATFNENTANYGFNFNDFKQATTIIYKAALAVIKVCGAGGSNMAADSETAREACESYYYGNYIHAFLLFVRTESEYETDDNGNRVKGDDGNDKLVALDEAGKAERQRRIAEIEAAVAAINAGETDPEYFFELMTAYDDGYASYDEHYADGYYFNRSEGYTQNFPIENVFETLVGIDINEAAKIEYEDGVCFVLRSSLADGAYSDTDESWCFGDFYELTANNFFADLIKKSAKEVDVRDSYDKLQFTKIPYMSENYVARFGG